ncbi:MAG: glycosyltransferase, partial [Terriglobales bacterium]
EYMAAALPLVLTDIPGHHPFTAEDLFPVGDAAALARHLQVLAADSAAAQARGRANRALVESYAGEDYRLALQRHYARALSQPGRRP